MHKKGIYELFIKRPLDFCLSLLALIILSPFIFFIALLVRINIGSPVLLKQKRPGLNENIFTLYKFRTMLNSKDSKGNLLVDDVRMTTFGKFLRSASLDELPSLVNILKGDMSIVGPRPLLVNYLTLYSKEQRIRHEVRPGLTGLAQVSGRNLVSWNEKFNLDVKYVHGITFINDFRIIALTFFKVLKREGISSENSMTTTPFEGNIKEGNKEL